MSDLRINKRNIIGSHGRHVCSLDTSDALAFLSYNDRTFKNSMTISSRNPNTRYFFRTITLIEKERQRHRSIKKRKVIHPLSVFRLYWEAVHLLFLFIGLLIVPINFIHGPDSYHLTRSFGFNYSYAIWEIVFDIIYMIDVIMTFFTGYAEYKTQVVHLHMRIIARKYMSTIDFYVDVACSVSTMFILNIYFNGEQSSCITWLRLIGLVKILRLIRFVKYLKNICELLHHFYYSKLVICYTLLIIIVMHWLTCIFILVAQNYLIYKTREDYMFRSCAYGDHVLTFDYFYMYLLVQNKAVRYVLWIHSTTSFNTAFDEKEYHLDYVIVLIFYSIIGFVFNNFLMILIIRLILSMNATESKYHSIMSQLLNYMRLKSLPQSMKQRFICYYEYRFQKNYFREATIMNMMSESLRHDINLHSCRSLTQNVSILRDLPADIISEVVFHLKHEVYLYNDMIVKADTKGDCMYFIGNGSVAVMTSTGREICHLQDGSYFGEIALVFPDEKRIANVIAIEICEVYKLARADFNTCFQKNTTFYKKIQQIAQERKEKTTLLEELHKKYLTDQTTVNNNTTFNYNMIIDE